MDWADRIGRRIRLRDLHILLAVAECGSMAKASAKLSVSHPVVSKTISELERTLGVRLFDRTAQGVQLTAYGTALLNCGLAVFDEMRQGLKHLEALTDPASGDLRIGCAEITVAGLLPAIVERFSQQYPRIRLHVVLAQPGMLQFQELRERNIDLVIGRVPQAPLSDDLSSELLFDEPFLAVAGMGSKLARQRHVLLKDLIDQPWILPPYDSVPGLLILQIFRASGLPPPQPSIVTLSGQLTVTLIASGRFVGVLPSSVAHLNKRRAGLKILPLKLPAVHVAAGIVTVKNRTLSPFAELFINCVRDVARPIAKQA
ncbi:MAG: LysR family transcriptional regulator [Xanthobacteraceae bacterium]|jgi:DNA-binding transcriptional LysR family regulator